MTGNESEEDGVGRYYTFVHLKLKIWTKNSP